MEEAAFRRLEAKIREVPFDDVRPPNAARERASDTILKAAPRFSALMPRMVGLTDQVDLWLVQHCAELAAAYRHASRTYRALKQDSPAKRKRQALELRNTLDVLVSLGLRHDFEKLARERMRLQRKRTPAGLAHDLELLTDVAHRHWAALATRAPVATRTLARVQEVMSWLPELEAYERAYPLALEDAARAAQQAYTLMCKAYDEVRCAVYLVQESYRDVLSITPCVPDGQNARQLCRDARARARALRPPKRRTEATRRPLSLVRSEQGMDRQAAAFRRFEAQIRALALAELKAPTGAQYRAACVVSTAAWYMAQERVQLEPLSGQIDLARFDECGAWSEAYKHAYEEYRRLRAVPPLKSRRRAAVRLRKQLAGQLSFVAIDGRAPLPVDELDLLYHQDGDAALAHDLCLLSELYRERWGELRVRDDIIEGWLPEADTLVACLRDPARYERLREQAREQAARAAQQTYVLMCRAYEELRKAVCLLNEADGSTARYAPSIPGARRVVMRREVHAQSLV